MAEWEYKIHRIELAPGADLDDQIGKVLHDYGTEGWELVQVMHPDGSSGNSTYRLIFKAEKPLMEIE